MSEKQDATNLLDVWADRDLRYVARHDPLSEDQINAVRAWREFEVGQLPPALQSPAMFYLAAKWTPPRRVFGG